MEKLNLEVNKAVHCFNTEYRKLIYEDTSTTPVPLSCGRNVTSKMFTTEYVFFSKSWETLSCQEEYPFLLTVTGAGSRTTQLADVLERNTSIGNSAREGMTRGVTSSTVREGSPTACAVLKQSIIYKREDRTLTKIQKVMP